MSDAVSLPTPYYDDGQITIYCAPWETVLPALPAGGFDLVFTSPPYNLGTTAGPGIPGTKLGHYPDNAPLGSRGGADKWPGGALGDGYQEHDDAMPHTAYVAWQQAFLTASWTLLSDRGAIFYNHKPRIINGVLISPFDYVPESLRFNLRQIVIWARSGGVNFSAVHYLPTHEWIVIVAREHFRLKGQAASGVGDVWSISQDSGRSHPAPFPLALPARAIETVGPNTVLDPHMGSGTTIVAARNAGCRAVGIDKSEHYCESAVKWLQQGVLPMASRDRRKQASLELAR